MFSWKTGVNQGVVLSPVVAPVCIDGLLQRLQNFGVGCHIEKVFAYAFRYADYIILLSPSVDTFISVLFFKSYLVYSKYI